MPASLNRATIIGSLGADPELRHTQGGQPVCDLRIATNDRYKGKDGEWHDATEWHGVVCWGKTAENAAKYLAKGRQVYVEGKLQTRSWDDQKTGTKRYKTEIRADIVLFLGGGKGDGKGAQDDGVKRDSRESVPTGGDQDQPDGAAGDDEIPF